MLAVLALVLAVTVNVCAQVSLVLDAPTTATVPQSFTLRGTAMQADAVHVWAFPESGAVFLGVAYPTVFDEARQLSTGFVLRVTNAPIGAYPVVVYAHDPVTGTFPTSIALMLTVRACDNVIRDWQFVGPSGVPVFWMVQTCL